jgi:hypothetical protein
MATQTAPTTHAALIDAAYDLEEELGREDKLVAARYVTKWRTAITLAGQANRLDLYRLLVALSEGAPCYQARSAAGRLVQRTFFAMDEAAAFGSTAYPLVVAGDRRPDQYDYSVTVLDRQDAIDRKMERQAPCTPDPR